MIRILRTMTILVVIATIALGVTGCGFTFVDMSTQDRRFIVNSDKPEMTFLIEDRTLQGKMFLTISYKIDAYAETARAITDAYAGKAIAIYPADQAPAVRHGKVVKVVPMEYYCWNPGVLRSGHFHSDACVYKATVDGSEVEGDAYIYEGLIFVHAFNGDDLRKMTPQVFADWAIKTKTLTGDNLTSNK